MINKQDAELSGMVVMVTRPAGQQDAFRILLEKSGAEAIALPCLEIESRLELSPEKLSKVGSAELVIFTSANAVEAANHCAALSAISESGIIMAIGNTTAAKLRDFGLSPSFEPIPPYNSEALIELITHNVNNLQNIAIIKGAGGRTLLSESLRNAGKSVELIDVYNRKVPSYEQHEINSVFLKSGADIVTISSNETLQNLVLLAGDRFAEPLMQLPLVVNSQRNAELAQVLGFQSHILIAQEPGDKGQLEAIKYWNRSYRFKL